MNTPVFALQRSDVLRAGFDTIPIGLIRQHKISFMSSDDITCSDTLFIGTYPNSPVELFKIWGCPNGRLYARPCQNDPTRDINEKDPEIEDAARLITEQYVNSGTCTPEFLASIPGPSVRLLCFYGQYFDTFEEAFKTTLEWLTLDPKDLPKEYSPAKDPYE